MESFSARFFFILYYYIEGYRDIMNEEKSPKEYMKDFNNYMERKKEIDSEFVYYASSLKTLIIIEKSKNKSYKYIEKQEKVKAYIVEIFKCAIELAILIGKINFFYDRLILELIEERKTKKTERKNDKKQKISINNFSNIIITNKEYFDDAFKLITYEDCTSRRFFNKDLGNTFVDTPFEDIVFAVNTYDLLLDLEKGLFKGIEMSKELDLKGLKLFENFY